MAKLGKLWSGPEDGRVLIGRSFWCPGCETLHHFQIAEPPGERALTWEFDGNEEKPTFSPSLLYNHPETGHTICHLFVRDGVIRFLNDCEHGLAGQAVDLPDLPTRA